MARTEEEGRVLAHRYRLERLLGRGGCGEVHAAFDLVHARRVALKLLRADAVDPQLEEGLRAEFRVLRSLSHPGIVQVHDFGRTEDGAPFYTMQLLKGNNLTAAGHGVDAHPLLEQVASALDYLHASGLVHSDLKPSNVFLVGGNYVLTDFGLVSRTRGARREMPYGTLAYLPPERLRAREAAPDPREDLYALGAILFEVVRGHAPYAAPSAERTIARILAGDLDSELADVPEPWARILRRLLAPEPEARFASAWELLVASAATFGRPEPVPALAQLPFVGRRRELAHVRRALADLARGKGAFLLVTGRMGMGKSALLEASAALAAGSGFACWNASGRAAPGGAALVASLVELYRRWLPGLPVEAATAARTLAVWLQDVGAARRDEELLNAHARALEAMREVAAAVPHVLLVDDAHRLDPASIALLRMLAADARGLGMLVLATGRSAPGAEATDPFARELGRSLQEGGGIVSLHLHELGDEDVALLVRRAFGPSADLERLATRIHEVTQGHPLLAAETLRHLVASGLLRRGSQGWQSEPQAEERLSPRVAETILDETLAAASPADRAVHELLALFPAGASAELLARVLGRDQAPVREVLERGVESGLLVPGDEGCRFAQELLREACAERCSPESVRRLHRRIADALAGTSAEAHHRLCASERTPESAACYLRAARAVDTGRPSFESLRYYAAALEADPGGRDADEVVSRVAELRTQLGQAAEAAALLEARLEAVQPPLVRGRFLHRLGGAYARLGRHETAIARIREAAVLLRAHAAGEERHSCAADLARILLETGDAAGAVEACRTALAEESAGGDPAHRSRLLLLQAQAERQTGDYAAAESTCRTALEVLKPLGRTLELAQTYTQLGTNHFYRRDFEPAERYYRAALKVHAELEDRFGLKNAYNNLALALMRAGKLDEAIAAHQESLALKRRLGDRAGEGSSLNNLGNLYERRGEYRRAFDCYRHGVGINRRLGRPREMATLYHNMAEVHKRLGRWHDALRLLGRAQRSAAEIEGAYIAQVVTLDRAASHLGLLDPESAIRILTEALPRVERSGLASLAAQFHAALALALARAGDSARARAEGERALEFLGPSAQDETGLDARIDLAEAELQLGRGTEAEAHAALAERLARAGDHPHARVRSLRILAAACLRRDAWDLAESRLREAIEVARPRGFGHEIAKCYRILADLHREIGLGAQAEAELERSAGLLEALGLRTELGLTYLELARLAAAHGS